MNYQSIINTTFVVFAYLITLFYKREQKLFMIYPNLLTINKGNRYAI